MTSNLCTKKHVINVYAYRTVLGDDDDGFKERILLPNNKD